MKARLIPLYFKEQEDEFSLQVKTLQRLLPDQAEILEPAALGSELPECEAVVFPQLLGDAYRRVPEIRQIKTPILLITSEFGTVSMWDWEIASYLKTEGIGTIAPYNLEQAKMICRALAVRRELKQTKFLVFQDNPGKGFQPSIFKRFYWWEDECTQRMMDKFGIRLEKKSFQKLGADAKAISNQDADKALEEHQFPHAGVSDQALRSAAKLYLAVKHELDLDPAVRAVGINCLNESHFSDTTPCLVWNLLYKERGLLWGCEGDTMSMLSEYILQKSLDAPLMMTNLYPFLMGQAALKHEHIPNFPEEAEPENHILAAHCGYLGVLPEPFSIEWTLRSKVLAIVDENATAIDARLPEGALTLAKLSPNMARISVTEAQLERYVQYEGSDCVNGGVIRVPDGKRMIHKLDSHHYILIHGHHLQDIELISSVFDLTVESL